MLRLARHIPMIIYSISALAGNGTTSRIQSLESTTLLRAITGGRERVGWGSKEDKRATEGFLDP